MSVSESRSPAQDLAQLLSRAIDVDVTRPLITYYDRQSGERTELSGTTLGNWVAKTANFLADGLDVSSGDTVAVVLPPHWQTAAVELATWLLGAAVTDRAADPDRPADIVFVPEDRLMELVDTPARDIVVTALHPLGLAVAVKPDHVIDYAIEVRAHGDHFKPPVPIDKTRPALYAGGLELTHAALVTAAIETAQRLGIGPDDRVILPAGGIADAGPLMWLLAPLAVGASIVLVRFDDDPYVGEWLRAVAGQERVTASLGVDVPGADATWESSTRIRSLGAR